jgi:ribonuclease Z
MAIDFQILGQPGRDNALLVRIDSGQSISRLLFDCGEGCLSDLKNSEVGSIDHVLFSHFHMDHISGFDSFFRCNYNRDTKPNTIWGPPGTSDLMHCRFRGFLWNLHRDQNAAWHAVDVMPDRTETKRFELSEAFAVCHAHGEQAHSGTLIDTEEYSVEALHLDHKTASLAYVVREKPRSNVDSEKLVELGLNPGAWLKQLKSADSIDVIVEIDGQSFEVAELRKQLLIETEGSSIAYLTDFKLDAATRPRLLTLLAECDTVICEAQYRSADLELAIRNYHMTTQQVAELARDANIGQLILFHLSDRYTPAEWLEMLAEAKAIFPRTSFAGHWSM